MMDFKQIASYDNYMIANMTLGMLLENNINCHLKDEHIVTIDPLLNPAIGGIKLMVAEAHCERAINLIKEAEVNYLNDIACPSCKSHSLVVEETTDSPDTFWGKLKNQIAYGQSEIYSKKYRCQACNTTFSELPSAF